ncbi:hypothetical protein HELRODRAFT_193392 [Helobdella robusta]|uniref:Uncharacterized protein n=1 Tax=Helobdella robusta TaxID=6412 RepID=T1FUY0_HELRO|nr:hypothetical protein HELRODRAFT_193392 [Helobdella robusta]ESN96895.1 hypothetical protein HELRODRAFT_193392 [Helobdella robusta]
MLEFSKIAKRCNGTPLNNRRDCYSMDNGFNVIPDNMAQCDNEIFDADATSLVAVKQRMNETKEILSDFKNRREPGKKRNEYIKQLITDLCFCYGYNEFLMIKLFDLVLDEIV